MENLTDIQVDVADGKSTLKPHPSTQCEDLNLLPPIQALLKNPNQTNKGFF